MTRRSTICLAMIVKNEGHVIRRCLESVLPYVDSYVIHDTGSTDDTVACIRETIGHKPGGVRQVPWVDFSTSRNAALDGARRLGEDYVLMMDADDVFVCANSRLHVGAYDLYDVELRLVEIAYHRPLLMRSSLAAEYRGVVHEYLDASTLSRATLPNAYVLSTREGARSQEQGKYMRDVRLLEAELERSPGDPRTTYYLAQSYRDAGQLRDALFWYGERAEMSGGWADEAWSALLQAGRLRAQMGAPWQDVAAAYARAWEMQPERAEALYELAMVHQHRREWHTSHMMLAWAAPIPRPPATRLFVETDVYDVLIPLELAVACYWIGDDEMAIEINATLLRGGRLTPALRRVVESNRALSESRRDAKGSV